MYNVAARIDDRETRAWCPFCSYVLSEHAHDKINALPRPPSQSNNSFTFLRAKKNFRQ